MIATAYGLAFAAMLLAAVRVVRAHRASQHQALLARNIEEIIERSGRVRALRYIDRAPLTVYVAIARSTIEASKAVSRATPPIRIRREIEDAFSAVYDDQISRMGRLWWVTWLAGLLAVLALLATPATAPAAVHFGLYTMSFSAVAMLGWTWFMQSQVRDGTVAHAPGLIDALVRGVITGDRPSGEGPGGASERVVSLGPAATVKFRLIDADGAEHELTVADSIIKIGRYERAHIRIDDDDLARLHAIIEVDDDELRLVDLGTDQGTQLNGEPIDTAEIGRGDVIGVGRTLIEICDVTWTAPAYPGEGPGLTWRRFEGPAGELRRHDLRSGQCPICDGRDIVRGAALQRHPSEPGEAEASEVAGDVDAAEVAERATAGGEDVADEAGGGEAEIADDAGEIEAGGAERGTGGEQASAAGDDNGGDAGDDDDDGDGEDRDRGDGDDRGNGGEIPDDWHREEESPSDEPTAFTCRTCGFSQWFAPGRSMLDD